ncbi:MAG: DUF4392 domain-containing protein [Methanomassiliicoccales archaeon]|nr:MAG: DUF4392 domain-containing protein [Methanomassiliicoccales archaeon]
MKIGKRSSISHEENVLMQILGNNVDRLVTVEIRPRNFPHRGFISKLYDEARERLGGTPLTLLAAENIQKNVKDNDNVIIVTGVGYLPFFAHGETDGPLGAACLARAVSLGLGAKPIFVVGDHDLEPVKWTAKAAGINIEEYDIVKQTRHTGGIIPFPYEDEQGEQIAKEIIDKYAPKALFSVETLGPNRKGVIHSAMGLSMTSGLPKLHHLFVEARKRGILTIGCIDCGNEIGGGAIEGEVRKVARYGDACRCPCKSGIACAIETDVTITATTSNWGAYGIAAMLAVLVKNPEVFHDADTERRMLEACIMAGGVDGISLRPIPVVDSISCEAGQGLVTLLHMIIENGLKGEEYNREI